MRSFKLLTVIAALAATAALALGLGVTAAQSESPVNAKHFFWSKDQSTPTPDQLTSDIIYHGGNAGPGAVGVLTKPYAYLIWWGTEWKDGFKTADTDGKLFSSKTLQTYLNSFFANVGGSAWAGVQTQYCKNTLAGSMSCVGGSGFVTNPKHQLKGTWTDPTPVPGDIVTLGLAENLVDDPIAAEAMRASAHFGFDPDATYIILTPPGSVATGQPVYCGYHTQTSSLDGLGNPYRIEYAFIPWLNTNWPGLGTGGCGMHNVNATSTTFGNGIFDGWSIVVGHEYSEAVTDPDNFFSIQDGWNDAQGSENADKCAWTDTQNITLGGRPYAIQPMWSNEAFDATGNGCVVSR
ncbi:MAG TPA: hypothetical protein VN449_05110 [Gaiellaceae bacterium]|nr:hypothetical protein [Gaiellaceae bacterium]